MALGAAGGSIFLATSLGSDIDPYPILALVVSIWMIYTFDHLLDAQSIQGRAITHRHLLHQEQRVPIISMFVIIGISACIFILPKLSMMNIQLGGILVVLVFVHWVLNKTEQRSGAFYFKEFRVSLIYALGIAIPVIDNPNKLSLQFFALLTLFWIIASINLITLSMIEKDNDQLQKQRSLATILTEKKVQHILYTLIGLYFLVALITFNLPKISSTSLIIISLVFLGSLIPLLFKDRLKRNENYRIVGDLSFCFSYLALI